MWNFFDIAVFAAGYVACVYTWPWVSAKIAVLKAKAAAIKAAL